MRYFLGFKEMNVPLPPQGALIGRSRNCTFVIDGDLVSRRHARIVVNGDEVEIEDLESANGVQVNGVQIEARARLSNGDRIEIGGQELVFIVEEAGAYENMPRRQQVTREQSPLDDIFEDDEADFHHGESTEVRDQLRMFVETAKRLVAQGRGAQAAKVLGPSLRGLLAEKRPKGSRADTAAQGALVLARATRNSAWLDYVFELYTKARRRLPGDLLMAIDGAIEECGRPSLRVVREYAALMRHQGGGDAGLLEWLDGLNA